MATRNKSLVFIQFRNEKKAYRKSATTGQERSTRKGKEPLLGKDGGYEMDDLESDKKEHKIGIPPPWMSIVDEVNYDIARIKTKSKKKIALFFFGCDINPFFSILQWVN
jgi:hypothetical protein